LADNAAAGGSGIRIKVHMAVGGKESRCVAG
jgi:hypothetical protein